MIANALNRVLSSRLEGHTRIQEWEIAGITVYYKPVPDGVPASEWRETLEWLLPHFRDAGWLEGFKRISICEGAVRGDGVGRYNHDGTIDIENDPSLDNWPDDAVVDDSLSYILTHEMVHHAHIGLGGFRANVGEGVENFALRRDVSHYATKDKYEAVAEVGAAIIHGHDFNDEIIDTYEKFEGPDGVWELRDAI